MRKTTDNLRKKIISLCSSTLKILKRKPDKASVRSKEDWAFVPKW